jgi:glycosyltransferase involved in cell wall biosynthesis
MAEIAFFLPSIDAARFSGGILTVCEYANGLATAGHDVTVISLGPVPTEPLTWFKPRFRLISHTPRFSKRRLVAAMLVRDKQSFRQQALAFLAKEPLYLPQRASKLALLESCAQEFDCSIATSYETALAAFRYGSGRKFYFAQHFEPLFAADQADPQLAEIDARSSYFLPELAIIANSSWLAQQIAQLTGEHPPVCLNAIDHSVFFPDGQPPDPKEKFVVISYGGRHAKWKGFEDAAEAVRIARKSVPNLEWRVFGDASLPPDNRIASYVPLGFITGPHLRREYSQAHVLLAPSWYESFPLFPVEAMACGAAVITTPLGTEDFAFDRKTALVSPPRAPDRLAAAIATLYENDGFRRQIADAGCGIVKRFRWKSAVERMTALLGVEAVSMQQHG